MHAGMPHASDVGRAGGARQVAGSAARRGAPARQAVGPRAAVGGEADDAAHGQESQWRNAGEARW